MSILGRLGWRKLVRSAIGLRRVQAVLSTDTAVNAFSMLCAVLTECVVLPGLLVRPVPYRHGSYASDTRSAPLEIER
eukprot:361166-Rhodomonas_salina.3